MILQGETFIAVSDEALLAAAWCTRVEQHIQRYSGPAKPITSMRDLNNALAKIPKKSFLAELIQEPVPQTPFQAELERTNTKIEFSKYPDGSLRLYPPGSIVGDTPAGYSEENVVVKVRVYRGGNPMNGYVVIIPTTRHRLDQPGAEEWLAQAAYKWRQ